jgi:hypothetical protein
MALPSHPPQLDYPNYTWRRVQITKLIMQFSSLLIGHRFKKTSSLIVFLKDRLTQLTWSSDTQGVEGKLILFPHEAVLHFIIFILSLSGDINRKIMLKPTTFCH